MMRLWHCVIVIAGLAILDQAVKAVVESSMALGEMIPMLPFLALLRAHNDGVAFSMFAGAGPWVLIGVTAIIMAGAAWMLIRTPERDWLARLGLSMILGGAIGNLIDRAQHAYVIDYIYFHTPSWAFAIFNLADAFITMGAVAVVADEMVFKPRRERQAAG
jgi:signal peptidase II